MTLEELKNADDKTKNDFANKIYTSLVKLYVDQYYGKNVSVSINQNENIK